MDQNTKKARTPEELAADQKLIAELRAKYAEHFEATEPGLEKSYAAHVAGGLDAAGYFIDQIAKLPPKI